MKYPRLFMMAVAAISSFTLSASASDRYTIRNARGQVTSRVTTCANGTCGKITDAAGRITGSFRTSGKTVRFYDRAGRPK